jgi:hypothetical protein
MFAALRRTHRVTIQTEQLLAFGFAHAHTDMRARLKNNSGWPGERL